MCIIKIEVDAVTKTCVDYCIQTVTKDQTLQFSNRRTISPSYATVNFATGTCTSEDCNDTKDTLKVVVQAKHNGNSIIPIAFRSLRCDEIYSKTPVSHFNKKPQILY